MDALQAASRSVNTGVRIAVFVMLLVMVAIVSAGVFWRYVLNDSLSWAEELARYLLVWISFLGASMATYSRAHISISSVVDRLPARWRWGMALLVDALVVAFLAVIVVQGIKLLPVMRVRLATTLAMRMDIVYIVLPLSAAIMILHVLAQAATTLKTRSDNP